MAQRPHAFSPQWYRGEASGSSSQSDGRSNGVSLSRLPTSGADRSRGLQRASSSVSDHGTDGRYVNFGRNRRERDRNRVRDSYRERNYSLDNEDDERFIPTRRDPPRRSMSSGVGSSSGGGGVASFESEFPSLGSGDRTVGTSALVRNGTMASVVSSTGTGLSMAERLAKAQLAQTPAPQIADDSETKKELSHYGKLIPRMKKDPVRNLLGNSKSKVAKTCQYNAPKKVVLQPSSQNHARHLTATKPDVSEVPDSSRFQVLKWATKPDVSEAPDSSKLRDIKWENNGHNPTAKDDSVRSSVNHHPKTTANHKPRVNGNVGEMKPLSKSQGRNDFFDRIRKMDLEANVELSSVSSTSTSECSVVEDGNDDACSEDFDVLMPPDEEEAALLRSLEWEENAEVEPLTKEEIESFRVKHPKVVQRAGSS